MVGRSARRAGVIAATWMAVLTTPRDAQADDEWSWRSIRERLDHDKARERRSATKRILAFDQVPDEVGQALVAAAERETERGVYVEMLCALGRTRVEEARPILEAHFYSPDRDLAKCAHQGLEQWLAHQGEPAEVPRLGPDEERRVAPGFHVESGKDLPLGYTGVALLAAGHAGAMVASGVALATEEGRNQELPALGMIPVVGPWLAIATVSPGPGADQSRAAADKPAFLGPMVASGIVQAAGAALTVAGFARTDVVVRDGADVGHHVRIEVGPTGATATLSF